MDIFEKLRESKGLKITEACDLAGISRSLYYSIRDKGQPVSEKAMDRVLKASKAEPDLFRQDLRSTRYPESSAPLSPRLAEPGGNLSKSEVRVLIGEIKLRLEMIQMAFENLHDE